MPTLTQTATPYTAGPFRYKLRLIVILRNKSGNYSIIESPLLIHDFKRELIITNEGTLKVFKKDSKPTEPIVTIQIKKMELVYPRNL